MTDEIAIAAWALIAAAFVATLVLVALEWRARLADRAEAARQFDALWSALTPAPRAELDALAKRVVALEQRAKVSSGLAETLPAADRPDERVVEVGPATTRIVGNGVFEVRVPRPARVPALGEDLPRVHDDLPPTEAKAGNTIVGLAPPGRMVSAGRGAMHVTGPGASWDPASGRGGQ